MKKRYFSILLVACVAVVSVEAQDRSVVNSYRADTRPTIDGVISPGEWDAAGPWIEVTSDSPNARFDDAIAEDEYSGPDDCSYRFRTMWDGAGNDLGESWIIYFVFEITDDIAMESDPVNLWERDQLELFLDGNDIPDGNDDSESFHWWASDEPFGKFGCSRYTTYEGNSGKMTDDFGAMEFDPQTYACTAVATETNVNANFTIEYAVTIEHLFYLGLVNEPIKEGFVIKYTCAYSDDDNFDTGTTERSHTLGYYRDDGTGADPGWDVSSSYADLTLVGGFTRLANWSVYE